LIARREQELLKGYDNEIKGLLCKTSATGDLPLMQDQGEMTDGRDATNRTMDMPNLPLMPIVSNWTKEVLWSEKRVRNL
jgi:hypothetical protein